MPSLAQTRAYAVHVLTASGAALALTALIHATRREWPAMFLCLGIALLIDGIDGALARACRVAERLPRWSGEVLDLVVDFTTYVFVPAYAMAASGLLPEAAALPLGIVVVVSGALYFADNEMKTVDHCFKGFPALWNAVAFYLFLLRPAPWLAAALVAGLVVLTFLPFKFIHPMRVRRLRLVNVALLSLWSLLALIALYRDLAPGPWIAGALLAIGLYFLLVGSLHTAGEHAGTPV